MSDEEDDNFAEPAAAASRRVSLRVAIAVVGGCAALGWVAGILYPLHPNAQRVDELPSLRLASAKLIEDVPAVAQPRLAASPPVQGEAQEASAAGSAAPEPPVVAPPPAVSVDTGSIDRTASAGAGESAVLAAGDRQAAERPVPAVHALSQRHHAARAKRLKRILWRRVRSKRPSINIDAFFASLVPKI